MEKQSPNVVLDTILIQTRRPKDLAEFYRNGFELPPPRPASDEHFGLELPGAHLSFDLAGSTPEEYPGPVSLWFRVDDLHTTYQRFVNLGAEVIYPPTEKPWGDTLAAVFDPDGNVLGLAQR